MTDDEIIEVVRAHKEGKQIECIPRGEGRWKETFFEGKPISWNFHLFDYRVKPEPRKPREWILNLCDGLIVGQNVFIGGGR